MIKEITRFLCEHGYNAEYDSQCDMVTIYSKGYHVEIQDEDGYIYKTTWMDDRLIDLVQINKADWGIGVEGKLDRYDVIFYMNHAEILIHKNIEMCHDGYFYARLTKEEN